MSPDGHGELKEIRGDSTGSSSDRRSTPIDDDVKVLLSYATDVSLSLFVRSHSRTGPQPLPVPRDETFRRVRTWGF